MKKVVRTTISGGRIYWYKKGKEFMDVDFRTAGKKHNEYRQQGWEYLGWSDGSYIRELYAKNLTSKTKGVKSTIREAQKKEIQSAIDNPDKIIPRESEGMDINGKPISDSRTLEAVRGIL